MASESLCGMGRGLFGHSGESSARLESNGCVAGAVS